MWQDVRGWYEFPDDHPDPPEVELVEAKCAACCRMFPTASGAPEVFCSWGCEEAASAKVQDPTPPEAWDNIPF